MHTIILGAGAVGGYVGGRIAQAGYPTTFLVRENRYKQLQQNGLHVRSVHGDFKLQPELSKTVEEIEKPDLVIVALKNYHLEKAMSTLEVLVEKGAKILPLLNGMSHLDRLREKFGDENVLGGLCYIESTLNEQGEVVQTSPMQDIVFGPLTDLDSTFSQTVKDTLEKSAINVTWSESILEDMWKKYIFLSSLSGITTASRQPIGVAIEHKVTYNFLHNLVREIYQVADSRGANLPEQAINQILDKMKSLSPTMTSSMHRDLVKGLPMELESLHGSLIEMAKENGVSTPCLEAIYALLYPYKDGQ